MLRVQCFIQKVFDLLLFCVNLLQCVGHDKWKSTNYIVMLCDINIRKWLQLCQALEVLTTVFAYQFFPTIILSLATTVSTATYTKSGLILQKERSEGERCPVKNTNLLVHMKYWREGLNTYYSLECC